MVFLAAIQTVLILVFARGRLLFAVSESPRRAYPRGHRAALAARGEHANWAGAG